MKEIWTKFGENLLGGSFLIKRPPSFFYARLYSVSQVSADNFLITQEVVCRKPTAKHASQIPGLLRPFF